MRPFAKRFARRMLANLVHRIVLTGHLVLEDPDGQRHEFGDGGTPRARVRITNWPAIMRLALNPDLALGESYMEGDLQMIEGTVYDLLDVIFTNLKSADAPGLSRMSRTVFRAALRLGNYNSPTRSKRNVAHHYDLDAKLYALFLDEDWQYSCAYFETPGASLDDAQLAKKRHLAAKLALVGGQSVLDIGSGWGGLALYLARVANVSVQGVTLSEEQLSAARKRADEAGLSAQVRFDLKDYRSLQDRFDRIVSVGMFEHVGRRSYGEFFSTLRALLADDGVAVLHHIGRSTAPSETNAWILKHIFPGGYMPALSEILPEIERNGLIVTDIEVLRLHYARTLRAWRERFMANRDKAVALYDERFARMWEFYLSASETGFRHQGLVIHQIQMARSQDSLPLTRDYIHDAEAELRQVEQERAAAMPRAVPVQSA